MIRRILSLALAMGVAGASPANADTIFVSLQNGTVQSFDVSLGSASAIAASGQTFTNQALQRPQELAFNATGDLFVASYDTSTVARYAPNGTYLPAGSIPSANLQNPFGIAFDASGNLFVVNGSGNSVSKFDSAGNYQASGSIAGNLDSPFGLTFDASGNLYAANANGASISRFDPSGNFMSTFASGGSLNLPIGLAFDWSGNLYAANYFGDSISKFSSDGTFLFNWSTAAAPRFLAVAPVPEPSTCIMALAGLACGGSSAWRRRKRS